MAINIDDLAAVLTEFKIQSIPDLRLRLTQPQSSSATGPEWHSGYQEGFIRGNTTHVQHLERRQEDVGRRLQIVERRLNDLDDRTKPKLAPRRRK